MVSRGYVYTVLRSIVIVLNLNFVVFGVVLCIFGVSQHGTVSQYEGVVNFPGRLVTPSPYHILLATAVLSLTSGILGLRSVDHLPILIGYVLVLSFVSFFHVGIALSTKSIGMTLEGNLQGGLLHTITYYNNRSAPQLKSEWDKLQRDLKCCGVHSYKDWDLNATTALVSIPGSCFLLSEDQITDDQLNDSYFVQEHVFSDGCLQKIMDDIGIKRLFRVSLILATAKFIAAICAGYLINSLRQVPYHSRRIKV